MLKTTNIQFAYPAQTPFHFPDIHCQRGEHCLLLGQSGSGKTTLLHLLAGLRTPQSGSIQISDTEIQQLSPTQLDTFRGKQIGIIFQQSHFLRALTIEENLLLAQSLAGSTPQRTQAQQLLQQLHISHKAQSKPHQLSVGEQQRAAIARALINRPHLILADEPTSALDDANTTRVIQLLKAQAQTAESTLLIVTHDQRLKAQFEKQIHL